MMNFASHSNIQRFKLDNDRYQEVSRISEESYSTRQWWSLKVWPVNLNISEKIEPVFKSLSIAEFSRMDYLSDNLIEFQMPIIPNEPGKTDSLKSLLTEQGCHYALMPASQTKRLPALLMFDMDSTLIQMECIDELARQCGFYDKVSAITESAMRGELDFSESLIARVKLLTGLPEQILLDLAGQLPVTQGVVETVNWCRQQGIKIAVVSGGFTLFVEQLKQQLDLDFAAANQLEVAAGKLTGLVNGDIVDGEYKRNYLMSLSRQLDLEIEQVWAIGDGANDIPMLQAAGLGVAFDAKPKVRESTSAAIVTNDMSHLLTLLKSLALG